MKITKKGGCSRPSSRALSTLLPIDPWSRPDVAGEKILLPSKRTSSLEAQAEHCFDSMLKIWHMKPSMVRPLMRKSQKLRLIIDRVAPTGT